MTSGGNNFNDFLKGKGSPYSTTDRRVTEIIPVLGSQPAGDVSHKPGGRLYYFPPARPAVTLATLKRAATNVAAFVPTRKITTKIEKTFLVSSFVAVGLFVETAYSAAASIASTLIGGTGETDRDMTRRWPGDRWSGSDAGASPVAGRCSRSRRPGRRRSGAGAGWTPTAVLTPGGRTPQRTPAYRPDLARPPVPPASGQPPSLQRTSKSKKVARTRLPSVGFRS